jgi:hypothetical protein
MTRSLWKLLLEDPSDLTCDECFAVVEYYAEILAAGGPDLLPEILKHLEGCPSCAVQHRNALRHLTENRPQTSTAAVPDGTPADESEAPN